MCDRKDCKDNINNVFLDYVADTGFLRSIAKKVKELLMPTGTILYFLAFCAELVAFVLLPLLRYFLVASVAFHGNFSHFRVKSG